MGAHLLCEGMKCMGRIAKVGFMVGAEDLQNA